MSFNRPSPPTKPLSTTRYGFVPFDGVQCRYAHAVSGVCHVQCSADLPDAIPFVHIAACPGHEMCRHNAHCCDTELCNWPMLLTRRGIRNCSYPLSAKCLGPDTLRLSAVLCICCMAWHTAEYVMAYMQRQSTKKRLLMHRGLCSRKPCCQAQLMCCTAGKSVVARQALPKQNATMLKTTVRTS